ncbi:MAG: hypothetical protein HYZ72_01910, partial [Deltaproteobacteria bacterium]|nr:hypothetical protein [Deltaproteobacteria bacterium]
MRAIPRALSPLPLTTLLVSLILAGTPWPAQAGCGCEKLPPPPAAVRPNATYAGAEVTLFHASLVSEQAYTVLFTSGITGESATVPAVAVTR